MISRIVRVRQLAPLAHILCAHSECYPKIWVKNRIVRQGLLGRSTASGMNRHRQNIASAFHTTFYAIRLSPRACYSIGEKQTREASSEWRSVLAKKRERVPLSDSDEPNAGSLRINRWSSLIAAGARRGAWGKCVPPYNHRLRNEAMSLLSRTRPAAMARWPGGVVIGRQGREEKRHGRSLANICSRWPPESFAEAKGVFGREKRRVWSWSSGTGCPPVARIGFS